MKTFTLFLVTIMLVLSIRMTGNAKSQDSLATHGHDSCVLNKGRLTGVLAVQGGIYVATLTGLYFAWYQNYPQSSFHFFNDQGEWMQTDKCGHMVTSYYISRIGYESYRWAGVKEKKAVWFGGLLSFAYLLNIEILDGFSTQWGFSPSDFIANSMGAAIFISQQLLWKEQRFCLKYSFHTTKYAQYRTDLLGKNLIQQAIKDYNGHSYWISGNISSFLPKKSRFPRWLNLAVGYGAEGMLGAHGNPGSYDGKTVPSYTPYRKFFLSVDVDLTRIPTRSKVLKSIFTVLSFIKIPAPALEYNTSGNFIFYPIYF